MKLGLPRTCRDLTIRRQWQRLHPRFAIISDPKKLAQLNAEVERLRLISKAQKR